ncbi:MAG: hypothetical protein KME06_18445 [Kastovskya adunca ATA6-11-RM4]|nr:hypothetical protein [Kastovskya adunca ATA6-11-RM4]
MPYFLSGKQGIWLFLEKILLLLRLYIKENLGLRQGVSPEFYLSITSRSATSKRDRKSPRQALQVFGAAFVAIA